MKDLEKRGEDLCDVVISEGAKTCIGVLRSTDELSRFRHVSAKPSNLGMSPVSRLPSTQFDSLDGHEHKHKIDEVQDGYGYDL